MMLLASCRERASVSAPRPAPDPPAISGDETSDPADTPNIVVASGVQGKVDRAVVLDAYRRAIARAEQDFGLRPTRPVMIYIDPDSAIGLEDALGLSQKYAIHLRAGGARSVQSLLPLMMHELTHTLQYQAARLRPQWWVEGQAEHQSYRILDPASAARERRQLYSRLAQDVRNNRAPSMMDLRNSLGWDEYIKRAGAGAAYGWGNAAVHFIESRGGFAAVARIMTDKDGPNTLSTFDTRVQETTGLSPTEFDAALRTWVQEQARG